MVIYLQHIEGSKKGQIDSFDADRVRVGRLPDNDLSFDPEADRAVSGHHAEIYFAGGSPTIRDLQSRNGTYVNSRRIDQPTPLSDGDTIQFAAKGPKVVFSKRDPSGGTTAVPRPGAPPLARPEVRREAPAPPPAPLAPDRAPARGPTPGPPPAAARRSPLRIVAIIVGAVVVLAALAVAKWLWLSWLAFAILLGILVIAAGGVLVWWWLRRRGRAASREVSEAESVIGPDAPGDSESLRELRRKWADALTMLRKSNLKKGRQEDPTSGVPWVLVLGETGSGKTETIRAANPISWLSPSGGHRAVTVTRNCDWWFFDSTVLLDTAGRYTFPSAGPADEGEWRELLSLLKRSRGRETLNGVIVAVAADTLVSRPVKQLQEEANQFRRRLDQMLGQLGATCPVYLLVTKMDLISGFTEYFRGLPDTLRGQAMGAANEDVDNRAGATAFFDRAFRGIVEKLHRLRLARLDEEESPEVLRRIYLFPEEFRALRAALRGFTESLFRQNPYRETPLLRSLLFTSARQGGVPFSPFAQVLGFPHRAAEPVDPTGVLFSRDLFSVILPQDRPLVERTAVSSQRTERKQLVAFWATAAVAVLLCGLFTLSFVRNVRALRRLDLEPCLRVPGPSAEGILAPRLRQLDACRETIEGLTLHSIWARVASNFGLNQTAAVEEPLQQRYLQTFRLAVLDPMEARLDQKLASMQEAPAYVSALVQQIKWLGQCRARGSECPPQDKPLLTAYRVMLGADVPGLREGDPRVGQLARTHEAYIWWQPGPQALEKVQAEYTKRVMGWLQAGGLRPDWILASARAQFAPVRSWDYWRREGGAQVDPPYTRKAWLEGIQPLLAGLRAMAPDQREVGESIARFEAEYRAEAFRQWRQFLASFPQGEGLVAGGRRPGRELAAWMLGPDSAYRRVIDDAATNLAPFTGGPQKEDIPAWALTLQRYADLKAKAAESQKGGKPGGEDRRAKAGGPDQEAVGYLNAYWDAVEQLRAELSTPERAFRAAKKALDEGDSSEISAFALQKASWNLERLKGSIGAPQRDDQIFWTLVERPYRVAWRAILDQAGVYLQQQWESVRPGLMEPQGSATTKARDVMAFVNGQAAPFLEPGSYTPKSLLLGERLSFTSGFLGYLARARRPSDEFGRTEPPSQIVVP